MSKQTTFEKLKAHLDSECHINLENHLEFNSKHTIKNYALASSLLLLYHYAQALGKKIQVRHAVAGGHKSHADLLTEMDFDLVENATDWKCKIHLEMAGDLLVISDKAKENLSAFRLGFYFDKFKTAKKNVGVKVPDKNIAGAKVHRKKRPRKTEYTKEKFLEVYGEKKAGASMHLGARYKFIKKEYLGNKIKKGVTFGMWGSDGTRDNTGDFWEKKIKEWKCGYLTDAQRDSVVSAFIDDCRTLDLPRYSFPDPLDKRSFMCSMDRQIQNGMMTIRQGHRLGTDPRSVTYRENFSIDDDLFHIDDNNF